ncbi:MAG: XRE family transcriptional regulator [Negativicutes bacterium]|nr:XRE family transcriptional regulator [Negativicutes bacterium]
MSAHHHNFSRNVANIRGKLNMSQEELATRADISRSMLSKIERGEVNPTILVASKIARGLNTLVSTLLDEKTPEDIQLRRKNERVIQFDPKTELQRQLILHTPTTGFELIHFILPSGATSGLLPPHKPGSHEYIIVEQGRLQVILDHDKVYLLDPGDCLSFPGGITHQASNLYPSDCHTYVIQIEPPD